MSKERTSLSLDPEVAQFLQQDHVNASGLVNKLVEQYMNGGAGEDMIRQFRIDQLESELNEIQAREDQKREELQKLKEVDQEKAEEKHTVVHEAVETLGGDDLGQAQAEHWADKADLPVDEFKEAYNEVRSDE